MKRLSLIILFGLIIALLLSINGVALAADKSEEIWEQDYTVDEFGDVTEDSAEIVKAVFSGSFSNTATNGSDLQVVVFIEKADTGENVLIFRLLEYGDKTISNRVGSSAVLKTKIDNEINEYVLEGSTHYGRNHHVVEKTDTDLYLIKGFCPDYSRATTITTLNSMADEYENAEFIGDFMVEELKAGKTIRCIIELGSSKYSFTMTGANLAEIWE